jgi:hypothetical protein
MKTKYILLGLKEDSFLTDAWLTANGISKDDYGMVYGSHLGLFDTFESAMIEAKRINHRKYIGLEIKPIFVIEK